MTATIRNIALQTRFAFALAAYALFVFTASAAFGHGNPVHVGVSDSTLIVSGGLAMPQGFADQAWDSHEDAALDTASGNRLTSTYPGYDVSGMEPTAPLRLEVISRPDYTVPGNPDRWLWYWNNVARVTSVPANARFDAAPLFVPGSSIQIQQAALVSGATTTMANQIGPFMNSHAHLISYQLQNASASQPGVYAFFARLTSPGLESSEPFLLAFRNQLSVDLFGAAINDINKAAVPSGDYNADGIVDAADYAAWRKTVGGEDEYAIWRDNFGTILDDPGGGGEQSTAGHVPEPATVVIGMCACLLVSLRRHRSMGVDPPVWH